MSAVLDPSLLEQGRAALARHDWRAAYDLLKADQLGELGYRELGLLAGAAWWVGRLAEAIEIRERAYAVALNGGDGVAAASGAAALMRDNLLRSNLAMASAWGKRAERILADVPETPVHGWLAATRGWQEIQLNQMEPALTDLRSAIDIGHRLHVRDVESFALAVYGMALVYSGDVDGGMAALDDATVGAIAGELEPQIAGAVCCAAITACTSQWFAEADAPYERAQAQVRLAAAWLAQGADERARLKLEAARTTFEQLGARLDLEAADRQLASLGMSLGPTAAIRERVLRAFVFTDIVDSTKLAELLGDDAWHDVIASHNTALRSVVAEFRGEEIKTIGDGFFLAFDDTDRAIEAAMAIQRRLAEHRQSHGFAPAVRIGIHRAEADRPGLDYIGTGVNTASRIGANATGGEILVSASTISTARSAFPQASPRTVALKGLAEPVHVVTIDWR